MSLLEEFPASRAGYGDPMLLRQFDEFYQEVVRMKQSVGIAAAGATADCLPAIAIEGDPAAAASDYLAGVLERQQRSAAYIGGDYMMVFDEARYVMAALADEIFLHANWDGRFAWNMNLLETRFYGTHVAGERLFQRIEMLLVASSLKARDQELAKVYLMALALGFQGKFREADSRNDLERYRRLLYYHITRDERPLQEERPLFPSAYQHMEGVVKLLPPVRRWGLRLALLVSVGLGVQHVVWRLKLTPDIWKVLRDILQQV